MIVRPITLDDVEQVAVIEAESMKSSWTEKQVKEEILYSKSIHAVAESNDRITGFVFFRICGNEAELMRISVSQLFRKMGVGRRLIRHGSSCLIHQGVSICFLEVRASNHPALSLYESEAFHRSGVRPGYYSNPNEDAIIMQKQLQ